MHPPGVITLGLSKSDMFVTSNLTWPLKKNRWLEACLTFLLPGQSGDILCLRREIGGLQEISCFQEVSVPERILQNIHRCIDDLASLDFQCVSCPSLVVEIVKVGNGGNSNDSKT